MFEGFEDRVRIMFNADVQMLPDSTINSIEFAGLARKQVDKYVEGIANIDEELLNSCYVYQTAIFILPILSNDKIKSMQTTHAKIEYNSEQKTDKMLEILSERLCKCLILMGVEISNSSTSIFDITNSESRYAGSVTHL